MPFCGNSNQSFTMALVTDCYKVAPIVAHMVDGTEFKAIFCVKATFTTQFCEITRTTIWIVAFDVTLPISVQYWSAS
jgi:hypothetical protein